MATRAFIRSTAPFPLVAWFLVVPAARAIPPAIVADVHGSVRLIRSPQ